MNQTINFHDFNWFTFQKLWIFMRMYAVQFKLWNTPWENQISSLLKPPTFPALVSFPFNKLLYVLHKPVLIISFCQVWNLWNKSIICNYRKTWVVECEWVRGLTPSSNNFISVIPLSGICKSFQDNCKLNKDEIYTSIQDSSNLFKRDLSWAQLSPPKSPY